ncbi:MAG: histidine phosphatase family protein [Opitutaceae bacterium]
MAITRFILIRHGETEWNAVNREMGQLDSPLTARGLEQADRVAERLATVPFDVLYSSDLGRAVQTATAVARKCAHTIVFDVRLRERHMGIFQGLTADESEARFPQDRAAYHRKDGNYVIPEGESAEQRQRRTVVCLDEIAQRHVGGTVVIITHGGILMGFFEHVLGLPHGAGARFRRPNAAWNEFTRDETGWVLETWGDVSHLS